MVDSSRARASVRARPGRPRGDARTRERALLAAIALFAEHGFAGTRLSAVAARVGVTNASLVHHFPSMEALYRAVLLRISHSLQRWHQSEDDRLDARERIVALIDGYIGWTRRHEAFSRIILRELLDNRARAARARHWYLQPVVARFIERVRQAQAEGAVRAFDPALFVFQFVGATAYFFAARPTLRRIGAHSAVDAFRLELLNNARALLRGHTRSGPWKQS